MSARHQSHVLSLYPVLQVAPELMAFEIVTLLLMQPTEDSVEMAVNFLKETGALLSDTSRHLVIE